MKYLEQAIAAHQSGNAVLAEDLYEQQLKEVPQEHNTLQLLGLLKMSTHRLDEGAKLMKASLDIEPQQPHVWNNLGACYKRMNRLQEAKQCFREALQHKPDFKGAHKNLISLGMQQQDIQAVWEAATQAIQALSGDPEIQRLYGKSATFVGKYDVAISVLEPLLKGHSQEIGIMHDLGIAYRMYGELEKALSCFETVRQQKHDNFSVFHTTLRSLRTYHPSDGSEFSK